LFADADGATKFADVEKLEAELAKLELTSQAGDSAVSRHCSQLFCPFSVQCLICYLISSYLFICFWPDS